LQQITLTEHSRFQWFPYNPPHSIQQQTIDPLLHQLEEYFGDRPKSKPTSTPEQPPPPQTIIPSTFDFNLAELPTTMKNWVVHCKKSRYDVYVGRPNPSVPNSNNAKWGNPFKIDRDGDRDVVIQKYYERLKGKPELIEQARKELKGKVLACWCAPLACHAHVLAAFANSK
jgi:hypothetical protein